jgi:hypothetical protein
MRLAAKMVTIACKRRQQQCCYLLLQDEWLGWDVDGERKIGSGWPALLGQGTD